jgi:hypothetical protein
MEHRRPGPTRRRGCLLAVRTLPVPTKAGVLTIAGVDGTAVVDAVLTQPELEWLILAQPNSRHATAMVRSFALTVRRATVAVPGAGPAHVSGYDHTGRQVMSYAFSGSAVPVVVLPGGFVVVRR